MTLSELAGRLDWFKPDEHRIGRSLGLHAQRASRGPRYQQHIDYDMAVRIAEALGVDPVDVGL